MIIGNGLLAKSLEPFFANESSWIVFASGVSNSREANEDHFLWESNLLREALLAKKKLIYFSTCSVYDCELQNTPYVLHKKSMEQLVSSFDGNYIFRLPIVVGKTRNPNTLTNYLYHQIKTGCSFQIWKHAQRNLIDVDDVALIVNYLVHSAFINEAPINIASPYFTPMPLLVKIFEFIMGIEGNYRVIDCGGSYPINHELAKTTAGAIGIPFENDYVERVIKKYYGK